MGCGAKYIVHRISYIIYRTSYVVHHALYIRQHASGCPTLYVSPHLPPHHAVVQYRCEAYVALGDADLALGSILSLQASNGTMKLIRRKYLTELLCECGFALVVTRALNPPPIPYDVIYLFLL